MFIYTFTKKKKNKIKRSKKKKNGKQNNKKRNRNQSDNITNKKIALSRERIFGTLQKKAAASTLYNIESGVADFFRFCTAAIRSPTEYKCKYPVVVSVTVYK